MSVDVYLNDSLIMKQGVFMLMESMAVKAVQTVLSADPDISVILFIYAVDCRSQPLFVRNLCVYELLLCKAGCHYRYEQY